MRDFYFLTKLKTNKMACELCGRNTCMRSFHSLEEQHDFDGYADKIKDRMRESLKRQIGKLKDKGDSEDFYLVDINEVIQIIDNY